MIIKILGIGCSNCKKLEKNAREAIAKLGLDAEVIKVTEMDDITSYGILRTPGLVVDEKVVSFGRIPTVDEIVQLIS